MSIRALNEQDYLKLIADAGFMNRHLNFAPRFVSRASIDERSNGAKFLWLMILSDGDGTSTC